MTQAPLTIPLAFLAAAERFSEAVAMQMGPARWTYRELERTASAWAGRLGAAGVRRGDRIGLLVEPGLEAVASLLGLSWIGAAWVPLDPGLPDERLRFMASDAGLSAVIADPQHGARLGGLPIHTLGQTGPAPARPDPVPHPQDVAYILYTSGSTGQPKGALIQHQGVVHLLRAMAQVPGLGPEHTLLAVASWSFDMSVLDLLLPLSVGARLVLVPREVARSGARLAEALDEAGATFFEATPATLGMLLGVGWRPGPAMTVLSAGEPLPRPLVAPLLSRGAALWNGYGMTEATVYTTVARISSDEGPLPVGRALHGMSVEVVGEDLRPLPPGEVGEIAVGGVGVGLGYLNRPELTARAFVADPRDPGRRLYRSGDLGLILPDGQLHCLGRRDRQVKIHGYRVELDEVEAALRAQPHVAQAAVAARGEGNQRRLIGAIVPTLGAPAGLLAAVREGLSRRLPAWMVPARLVSLEALPLTPAGKVDRDALPEDAGRPPWLGPWVAPEPGVEAQIARAMAAALGVAEVGAEDDLFAWGGSSLLATLLSARLHEAGLPVSAADVFGAPTPRGLAGRVARPDDPPLERVSREGPLGLGAAQRQLWFLQQLDPAGVHYNLCFEIELRGPLQVAPLRAALLALWTRHEALRSRILADAEGPRWIVDPPRAPPLPLVDLEHLEADEQADEAESTAAVLFARPFDLAAGPLARASLLRLGGQRHRLLLAAHHVIADGWSMGVWVDELAALLRGETLGPTPLQPADIAAWQARRAPALAVQVEATRRALAGAPARLSLPGEVQITGPRSTRGGAAPLVWSAPVIQAARALAAAEGATLYAVLLAAVSALLAETGQRDLLLGTFFANRVRGPLEGVFGHLADTVALRVNTQGATSFRALVRRAQAAISDGISRSEAPFLDVVAAVAPARGDDQPLVQAAVVLQPRPARASAGPLEISLRERDSGSSPFDLLISVTEEAGGLEGTLCHRLDRLPEGGPLASRLIRALEEGVSAPDRPLEPAPWPAWARDVVEVAGELWTVVDPSPAAGDRLLAALPLDPQGHPLIPPPPAAPCPSPLHRDALVPPPASAQPQVRNARLHGPPSVLLGPPLVLPAEGPRTLPELLRRAASGGRGLSTLGPEGLRHRRTWAGLFEEASRVAAGLMNIKQSEPEVMLLQLREPHDLLLGLWGCFLAGVVAVPLAVPPDPSVPSQALEKLRFNHEDLGAPAVIARGEVPLPGARVLQLDALAQSPPRPLPEPDPDALALLLQTSGSTGRPKAVCHTARTILSMLHAYTAALGLGPEDVYLNWLGLDHVAPLFMVHLSAALHGAEQVNLPTDAVLADPRFWLDAVHRTRASTSFAANFAFGLAADAAAGAPAGRWDLSCYRRVTNGGELVSPATLRRFARVLGPQGLPADAMVPIWGMSETGSATLVAVGLHPDSLDEAEPFVSVGGCIAGFDAKIVDEDGGIVPQGALGRLLVRGASVTPGYHRRPDANAASFTADGWFDTGDLAFIDGRGVALTGRAKDVLIIRGVHYPGHTLEETAEGVPGVAPSCAAAVAIREPGDETDRLLVVFAPAEVSPDSEEAARIAEGVRRAIAGRFGIAPAAVVPVARTRIPKTEIGKIQRPKLRAAWDRGELRQAARAVELRQDPEAAVPPWFFEPMWRPRPLRPVRGHRGALGVLGEGPRARAVGDALGRRAEVRRIAAGEGMDGLGAVLDLRALDPITPHQTNNISVDITTLQSVLQQMASAQVPSLLAASMGGAALSAQEALQPDWLPRLGLLRSAPQERPGLRVRAVDLDEAPPEVLAERLLGELDEIERDEPEVAWRGQGRWVRRLAPVALGEQPWEEPLAEGAPVLLVGGLGGLGARVTEALMRRSRIRPLLIGRRPEAELPAASREALEALRRLGPVAYAGVDAADGAAVERAVAAFETSYNTMLQAVFHLAAALDFRLLTELSPEDLESALRGPVHGGRVSARIAQERCAALVIFSTVNALFGGFAASAYAAGGRFGEGLAHEARRAGGRASWLAWSHWTGVGVSANGVGASAAEARGYRSVAPALGLASTLGALGRWRGDLAIGLDPGRLPLRRWVEGADARLPAPVVAGPAPGRAAPESPTERQIAAIWCELLGRGSVGVNENFFELGGHSILLAQLGHRLEGAFGVPFPVPVLFARPTVRALAAHLSSTGPDPAAAARERAQRQRMALLGARGGRRDG